MSSFDRRYFLMLAAALGGCGFQPVYGPGGPAAGIRNAVALDPPRDEAGFALVRRLEERLGLPDAPHYRMAVRLYVDEQELGVTPDQVITRYNLRGRAEYSLVDLSTGDVATSGRVSSFSSYSATGTPFATLSARRDAEDRLMTILADQIVSRLLVTAGEWREQGG